MPTRWILLLLFELCFFGCDNAAKQQRDNEVHRSKIADGLIQQGEAMQIQQAEEENTERRGDDIDNGADGCSM